MISKKEILLSILAGIIPSILTLGYKIFGPIILIFSYFTPLPFFLISLKYSLSSLIISITASISILILFSSITTSLLFFIINIIPAILISIERRNKIKFNYGNIIAKITLIKSLIFLFISTLYSEDLLKFSLNFFNNLKNLTQNNLAIEHDTFVLIPAIIISSWIIILFFNLIIAKNIILKFGKNTINNDKFLDIFVPKWLTILFLLIIIPITILQLNLNWLNSVAIITSVPITIQGLTVIHVIFKNIKMGKILLYTFYGIIFFIPTSIAFLTALGVLDNFYNLKKLKNKNY